MYQRKKALGGGKCYKIISLGVLLSVLVFPYFFTKEETLDNGVSLSWNYIGESNAPSSFPTKEDGYIVDSVSCTNGNGTWDEESWGIRVSNFTGTTKCTVTFDDKPTGPNAPELIEGLIPVTWNGSNWVKADTKSEWYNYDEQWWANAVTVTSTSRDSYNSASANTVISMDDIETMWVWIPRYSYTIGNTYGVQGYGGDTPSAETPGAVDIKFIDVDTKELGTAQYTGSIPSEWRTPDGFTFGSQELPGIWVAKFETSPDPASDCFASPNDINCDTFNLDPMIKPNVESWIYINIGKDFTVSQRLTRSGNRYGLDTAADSHMMKNSEWGVVTYLSQSKYGKYGNTDYTGTNKEVYKNNNKNGQTGCSGGSPNASSSNSCQYAYSVEKNGTGASTTGTIYGVYDMNGGMNEYVMSNYNNLTGGSYSGFSSMPDQQYYDLYTTSNVLTACNGGVCYGHALSETTNWYGDNTLMVNTDNPWALRGGVFSDNANSGLFSYDCSDGDYYTVERTFRIVLTPAP